MMIKMHTITEDCMSLDSRIMAKLGIFRCENVGTWEWHDITFKEMKSGISYWYDYDFEVLTLGYIIETEKFKYGVDVVKTSCNFGGVRYWFKCPFCLQRIAKLYCKNFMFLCRECHSLNYDSQQCSKRIRSEKENDVKRAIHENTYINTDPHVKFEGLHYLTFTNFKFRHGEHEQNYESDIDESLDSLLQELELIQVEFHKIIDKVLHAHDVSDQMVTKKDAKNSP